MLVVARAGLGILLVRSGLTENTGETCLALVFLVIAGPYLSHATMRAIRVREKGDWLPGPGPGKEDAK